MNMNPELTIIYDRTGTVGRCGGLKISGLFCATIFAVSMAGCAASSSISESSNSLSTSFKSSSRSSASSSEERKEAYLGDISHYTAVYTRSHSDVDGLTRGLAAVSEKHGITNWEANTDTYVGIGNGFARAELPQQQVDNLITSIARGDRLKIVAMQKGFSLGR
jgi:hypothetical protein